MQEAGPGHVAASPRGRMAQGMAREELWKRTLVLVGLVVFCLWPMWAFPLGCDGWLVAFTLGGAYEWWLAVCRKDPAGLRAGWAWLSWIQKECGLGIAVGRTKPLRNPYMYLPIHPYVGDLPIHRPTRTTIHYPYTHT